MKALNKVELIGRIGRDIEEIELKSGAKVFKTSLATTETFKKNGEKVDQTSWHSLEIWGTVGELFNKFNKKGTLVYVEGPLQYSTWEVHGEKRSKAFVRVNEFLVCSDGQKKLQDAYDNGTTISTESRQAAKDAAAGSWEVPLSDVNQDDELPF